MNKILILSSSFRGFTIDKNGNKIPCKIDNENNFLDTLKKYLTKRDCMVIISGNPQKTKTHNTIEITKKYFELSEIPFKKYIYVNIQNKDNIKEYINQADCINLFGDHLPTGNKFINELNLKDLLKDYSGVIIGGSGGAMNMAETVYCKSEESEEFLDKSFKKHLKGLGLININIIPHYNIIKNKSIDNVRIIEDILIPDSFTNEFFLLPDGSYIVQENKINTLYGEAYFMKNGEAKQICKNGESLNISKIIN